MRCIEVLSIKHSFDVTRIAYLCSFRLNFVFTRPQIELFIELFLELLKIEMWPMKKSFALRGNVKVCWCLYIALCFNSTLIYFSEIVIVSSVLYETKFRANLISQPYDNNLVFNLHFVFIVNFVSFDASVIAIQIATVLVPESISLLILLVKMLKV